MKFPEYLILELKYIQQFFIIRELAQKGLKKGLFMSLIWIYVLCFDIN